MCLGLYQKRVVSQTDWTIREVVAVLTAKPVNNEQAYNAAFGGIFKNYVNSLT